jgi:ABC-2 type transport system ATP-binding protein
LSRRDRIPRLSNGQQRQVGLLCAVSHYADLLLLDEPAAGLDPAARREFLEASIQLLNTEGTTILLSSHHMTDVERLGGRIVLLDQGIVRLDRDLDHVRDEVCVAIVPRAVAPNGEVFQHAAGCLRVRAAQKDWHVVIEGTPDDVQARLAALTRNDRVHCASVPLEELFVELVGSEHEGGL